ncbi:MAG TPA: UDP-glucose 4-epimerase GalE [Bacteroidia bacterium]|jgi:UDP-glucose 4-epimerase|nr:UDP-glucose 4-epimerase GalE [Bacteroidia bacterium]
MGTKKNKILLTGGAGYIGSHTIIELLGDDSFEVVSIDNYSNSDAATYDRIKKITGREVKFHECDLCDEQKLRRIFSEEKNIAGVIHFAALKSVPESVEKPELYYHNNIDSLENLLRCCADFGVHHFIFSSSCSVYGNIDQLPVNENSPLAKPESPYADTKLKGENMLREFTEKHPGFHAIALRYFNPVGAHLSGLIGELPRNRPNNLFPVITQTAAGKMKEIVVFGKDYPTRDGTCIRDYIHVSDIARAHVLALKKIMSENDKPGYDVMNLGSGEGVTVYEALQTFEKETGVRPNYRFGERRAGDVVAIYSDSSKALKELGWKPVHSLADMVNSAWKWQLHLEEKN